MARVLGWLNLEVLRDLSEVGEGSLKAKSSLSLCTGPEYSQEEKGPNMLQACLAPQGMHGN